MNIISLLSLPTDTIIENARHGAAGDLLNGLSICLSSGNGVGGPGHSRVVRNWLPNKERRYAIACTFLLLSRVLAICIFPVMGMVAIAHEPVFRLLLSDKWSASGELFMIVAQPSALQSVTGLTEQL